MTGDELKKYRKSKRLTQKELGEEYGFTVHAVRKWEQAGEIEIPRYVMLLTMRDVALNPDFSFDQWRKINLAAALSNMTVDEFIEWAIDEKVAAIENARKLQKKHISDSEKIIPHEKSSITPRAAKPRKNLQSRRDADNQ